MYLHTSPFFSHSNKIHNSTHTGKTPFFRKCEGRFICRFIVLHIDNGVIAERHEKRFHHRDAVFEIFVTHRKFFLTCSYNYILQVTHTQLTYTTLPGEHPAVTYSSSLAFEHSVNLPISILHILNNPIAQVTWTPLPWERSAGLSRTQVTCTLRSFRNLPASHLHNRRVSCKILPSVYPPFVLVHVQEIF